MLAAPTRPIGPNLTVSRKKKPDHHLSKVAARLFYSKTRGFPSPTRNGVGFVDMDQLSADGDTLAIPKQRACQVLDSNK
jgi:hypothetical protein